MNYFKVSLGLTILLVVVLAQVAIIIASLVIFAQAFITGNIWFLLGIFLVALVFPLLPLALWASNFVKENM